MFVCGNLMTFGLFVEIVAVSCLYICRYCVGVFFWFVQCVILFERNIVMTCYIYDMNGV